MIKPPSTTASKKNTELFLELLHQKCSLLSWKVVSEGLKFDKVLFLATAELGNFDCVKMVKIYAKDSHELIRARKLGGNEHENSKTMSSLQWVTVY